MTADSTDAALDLSAHAIFNALSGNPPVNYDLEQYGQHHDLINQMLIAYVAFAADGGPAKGIEAAMQVWVVRRPEFPTLWAAVERLQEAAKRAAANGNEGGTSLPPWPTLDEKALYGLAGDIVRLIAPHTEADPVALLIQELLFFGNVIGGKPHCLVEADRHALNEDAVLVGATAKARKGTSVGHVRRVYRQIDSLWADTRVQGGLSSGEGLIWAVRDPIEKDDAVVDRGVDDKRLLVLEAEFASTLRVLGRDGNTLSAIIRYAWDGGKLSSLTKNSPAQATGAHISILGHITRDELLRYLSTTEAGNGFGNRFLWCCVKRSKALPEGGALTESALNEVVKRLQNVVKFAGEVDEIKRDDDARTIWRAVYPTLSEGKPGLLGAMISRAEAHVLRLSAIYALLDCSAVVRTPHLKAALALWEYAEASARFIFGDALGDPLADEILRLLRANSEGLTRTDISNHFGRHKDAKHLTGALSALLERGLVSCEKRETEGRPAEVWMAIEHAKQAN